MPAQFSIPPVKCPHPWLRHNGRVFTHLRKQTPCLFKYQDKQFGLVKSYPCIVGANGTDKKRDWCDPKGSYFPAVYAWRCPAGRGRAFIELSTFLDRKARKNGGGIWILAIVPQGCRYGTSYKKGCIAVSNGIKNSEISSIRMAPAFQSSTGLPLSKRSPEVSAEVFNFIDAWRQVESNNTGRYLSYYSNDFINVTDGFYRLPASLRSANRVRNLSV